MTRSRKVRLSMLAGVLALGVVGSVNPAGAISPLPIYCQMNVLVTVTPGTGAGPQQWTIDMAGSCSGDLEGPYAAQGVATGTSDGVGLCGGGVVQNFDLDATIGLFSTRGSQFHKILHDNWTAPITTFPIATPFLINGTVERAVGPTTNSIGGGVLFHGLRGPLGDCPGQLTRSPAGMTFNIRTT
jgi:hypothetical protein